MRNQDLPPATKLKNDENWAQKLTQFEHPKEDRSQLFVRDSHGDPRQEVSVILTSDTRRNNVENAK